jgi:hypothetical protein
MTTTLDVNAVAEILKRVTHRLQLKHRHPYLVAIITSGDHPIQWCVYKEWRDWQRDVDIEDEQLDDMMDYYVYELPYSYVSRHRPQFF